MPADQPTQNDVGVVIAHHSGITVVTYAQRDEIAMVVRETDSNLDAIGDSDDAATRIGGFSYDLNDLLSRLKHNDITGPDMKDQIFSLALYIIGKTPGTPIDDHSGFLLKVGPSATETSSCRTIDEFKAKVATLPPPVGSPEFVHIPPRRSTDQHPGAARQAPQALT